MTIGGSSTTRTLTTAVKMTSLAINSGNTFVLAGNTFEFASAAAVSNSGTFQLQGGETLTNVSNLDTDSGTVAYVGDGAGGTTTFTFTDFGGTDYNNLTITSSAGDETFQSGAAKAIAGTLTVTAGTYNANGQTTTVTGLATVSGGTYSASTATQTFDGGLTVSSGTFTGSSGTVDVNGALTLSSGTLTAPSTTLFVSGNFSHTSGTFTHNSGTVILDGTNQTISGSSTFNKLTKTVTSAATLTFASSTTQTIVSTLTLQGASANLLSLRSSTSGTQWSIDPQGTRTLSFLDVKDSNNVNATVVECLTSCTNSGNNTAWVFSSTRTQSAYRLFNNLNSASVGEVLAAQDTAATAPAQGTPFRLRMLVHTSAQVAVSGDTFKLQVASKSGTCDTSFSGETYADVATGSGAIRYADNSTPTDGSALTANASDPTHGSDTIVNQTYEEANNFTNSQADIPLSQDGKWDFALVDNSAQANTSYCFRIVKSDSSTLDTYSVIPEIATAAPTIQFTATSSSGSEATTPASLTVTLSAASSQDVSVTYAATGGTATGSGSDYTLSSGTVTFTAGDTSKDISLSVVNDTIDENDETVIVALSNPSNVSLGSITTYTYTIQDNDEAATTGSAGAGSETGGGGTSAGGATTAAVFSKPKGPFAISINNGAARTSSREVTLTLMAGTNVSRMAISNFPDFREAYIEPYSNTRAWTVTSGEGLKTIYLTFYAIGGQASEVSIATIMYQHEEAGGQVLPPPPSPKPTPHIEPPLAFIPLPFHIPPLPIPPIIEPFIPDFLKPTPLPPVAVPIETFVPKETPLAFQHIWILLPARQIERFVFAPLPRSIKVLTEKFAALEKTFKELGIIRISDLSKLEGVTLELPGVSELSRLPQAPLGVKGPSLPKGIPLVNLPQNIKRQLPSEVVFPRIAGNLVDLRVALSLSPKGEPQEKIRTIAGKPLSLSVKPDKAARQVKGYVVFRSRNVNLQAHNLRLEELVASPLFALPKIIREQEGEKPSLMQAPSEGKVIKERLVLLEFEYTDADGDGIYTADIQAPTVEGEYEVITVIEYEDPNLGAKELRLLAVVDPEGYVYEKLGEREIRVPGAIVTLYWLNPVAKAYEAWQAQTYQQENPQVTNVTGKYSFLVPEGSYYIKVEAPGYLPYEGKPFQVKEGSGVHANIELKTQYWWAKSLDWKALLLIIVSGLLLYNFYQDRKRKGRTPS